MAIREATDEDARLLATEFWFPLAEQMEAYTDLNELRDDAGEHAVDGFERLLASDDVHVFLREDAGDPVAFVTVELGEHPSRERGRYASINDLYVKEAHRGQGHGTALVERAEALADREDCDFLKVSAEWENRPAREFYRDRGYEPKQVTFAKPLY
ncbi:GNAT family N-acetyltransferase [Halorubellus sp. JP-L1]|uniref:GNAT family N-acetyltransferase n=1 Tax=Halorubellus sp. JP-L1 TaxID=2715753 RepID=UPI00140C936C|nr:GNAT family N-acetyltransferase [Halorubellus sp. JP-L1]NHN41557.1 GNAT family N-acetyltransferase [Halorubellus sp. JP-L1]